MPKLEPLGLAQALDELQREKPTETDAALAARAPCRGAVSRALGRRPSAMAIGALTAALLSSPSRANADDAVPAPPERAIAEQPPLPPPPPRRGASPTRATRPSQVAPPPSPLELVGRTMSISGLVASTAGTAILTVGLFSRTTDCAEDATPNACEGSSSDDLLVGGGLTLSLGALVLIAGVILTQVATPDDPTQASLAPRLVGAPSGVGLGWSF